MSPELQRMEQSKSSLQQTKKKRERENWLAENDEGIGDRDKEMTVIFPMILK